MLQRRQFLGACSAICVTSLSSTTFAKSNRITSSYLDWDSDVIRTIPHNQSRKSPVVTGVTAQPNGSLLAIVGDDHHISVYDAGLRKYVNHLDVHTDWVRTAKFSPNGESLITAGNDRTINVWQSDQLKTDSQSIKPLKTRKLNAAVIETAIDATSKKFATVGFEKSLRLFDLETANTIHKLDCPCSDNHAVAFSGNGQFVAAGGRDGKLAVWETETGKSVLVSKIHRQRIRSLQFSGNDKVVTGSDDRTVKITSLGQLNSTVSLPRQSAKLYTCQLLANDCLATGGSDNMVHVWNLSRQELIGTLAKHTGTVSCLDYWNGKLVSGSYDTTIRIWHVKEMGPPSERHTEKNGWNHRFQ